MNWDGLVGQIGSGDCSLNYSQVMQIRKALTDNIKKAQDAQGVGYQTGASGGNLAALLPQSIDAELATIPYSEKDLVFHKMLPEDKADQTLQEIRVRLSHGDKLLDKNTSEGEITSNNQSTYSYRSLRMRFWTESRELTDVASALTGIGVPAGMLAEATQEAGLELLRSIETDDLFGDNSLNPNKPDGIIRQIETDIATGGVGSVVSSRIEDFEGAQLTLDYLEARAAELVQPNVAANPTGIFVTPRVFRDLSRQQDAKFRADFGHDPNRAGNIGFKTLSVLTPKGELPIISVPFLDEQLWVGASPAAGGGDSAKAPVAPTVAGGGTGFVAAAGGKAKTAEAGAYIYKVVACNAFGYSAPLTSPAAVTVAATQKVTIKFDIPGSAVPTYYRIYRSDKNGVAATCKFLRSIKEAEAGGLVAIEDDFAVKPNCSKVLFLRMDKREIAFYKLLPTARVPLAKTKLTTPFTIFASGAPCVKVPEHQFVVQNVGVGNAKPVVPA